MFPLTSQCQIRPITLKPTNETVLLPNLKKLVELPPFCTCSSENTLRTSFYNPRESQLS